MSLYKPEPEEEIEKLQKKYREGRTAVRWAALAILFMIGAVVAQVVWFIHVITDNPNAKASFIAMVGSLVLAEYCRWCANDSKPESWK